MALPEGELPPLRFYALSTSGHPALEILGEGEQVIPLALTAVGQGRHAGEKLWTADLGGMIPAGDWQFRLQLDGTRREHPPYAPFYTTSLRSVWLQDRQVFGYRPAPFVNPSRVIKVQEFVGSLPTRALYVYLPRGYQEHTDRRYPVLYMHDGQNCFEAFVDDSFAGSWQAELTADLLIGQGLMQECIIVGVGHGQEERVAEYLPPYARHLPKSRRPHGEVLGGSPPVPVQRRPLLPLPGRADHTVAYYRDEVAPYVGRHYRVLSGREHTATCGSSLGGLFTLHLAWEHPQFAQHHAALSASFWITRRPDGRLEAVERLRHGLRRDVRLWLDSGTMSAPGRGDDGKVETLAARDALLESCYVEGVDFQYYLDEGATHSEGAWASRLPLVFSFLFPASP
jgi:predicted alpha/beta superfamily hydrolase